MRMTNRRRIIAAFTLALALAACGAASRESTEPEPPAPTGPRHTTISQAAAEAAGVRVLVAGRANIQETLQLSGRVAIQPSARAEVRAPYNGVLRALTKNIGERVRRGEVLARVESSESLQTYSVIAPLAGIVLERSANVGELSGDRPLFVVGDLSRLEAELAVFPRDADRVRTGQTVILTGLDGGQRIQARLATVLPSGDVNMSTLVARAPFAEASDALRPGMSLSASVVLAETPVALAVTASALQRVDNEEVIFIREGEVYTARPVRIGRRSPDWLEVLSGLTVGETYVSENAFIIKAEIEKSGEGDED